MLYCLINPSSQSRKGIRTWRRIEKEIIKEKIPYKSIITKSMEDVVKAARILTTDNEKKQLIIIGGDGTLNAFVNGIVHFDCIEIGYLPVGSGNDFARGMGITKNYKEELQLILHDRRRRHIFYGIANFSSGREQRFLVSSGIGYDARVCYDVDCSKFKKIFNLLHCGRIIYLFTGVRYLLRADTFGGTLNVDGEDKIRGDHFLFCSFHMLPYEGGGFNFCPDQRPEQNKLHICSVEGVAKWKIPFIIPQALAGTHIYRKGISIFQCREASIVADTPQYIHRDGETDHKYERMKVTVSDEQITFLN